MIRALFFPEQLGGYYFFSKHVVGFDIGKTHITATQILLKGRSIIIEKTITEKIDNHNGAEYTENAGSALKKIIKNFNQQYEIRTSLASSAAIFKELRLPFIGRQQIGLTVDFEVEPLLPFPLEDAIIDFVITSENVQEKSSEILVAAVQKQYIIQHLELFAAAGIVPDVICIDSFSLYSFYAKASGYTAHSGGVVLIDIGSHTTTLSYLLDGQLRLIRSLPKGVIHLAKNVSDTLEISLYQAMETIIRYGLEKEDDLHYRKALTQSLETFWREISFTLQSFAIQVGSTQISCRLLLFGGGSYIKGLPKFVTQLLKMPTELWDIDLAVHEAGIQVESKIGVSRSMVMSLCTALPLPPAAESSLLKKEFTNINESSLFKKQFLTTCGLIMLLFSAFITETIIEVRSLHNEIAASDYEARTELKKVWSGLLRNQSTEKFNEQDSLEDLVEEQEHLIKNEEKLWFSFANPARTSFLKYLLELTSTIDKKALGFIINKLTIADGIMILDAQVKDREALKELQKELKQSKLFVTVERQEDPSFKAMKIKLADTE